MSTGVASSHTPRQSPPTNRTRPLATDDEILGLLPELSERASRDASKHAADENGVGGGEGADALQPAATASRVVGDADPPQQSAEPQNLKATFDANPELRRAWHDAQEYRSAFATPEEARAATTALADLERIDSLFFSGRPEQHSELARMISKLDPTGFASLARQMGALASASQKGTQEDVATTNRQATEHAESPTEKSTNEPTVVQQEFFHSANAAAVQSVVDAIEAQVERLLPESVSKNARGRLVGEIYREIDGALRSNRQLTQQLREAFRSGPLDSNHQRAIVSLLTARAKQALPGIAKRVLNEWSSTILATHEERRARQRASERRVDIAGSNGSGQDGRRQMTPRDIDYSRMSDSDILNL